MILIGYYFGAGHDTNINKTSGKPVLCMEICQHMDLEVLQFWLCFSSTTFLWGEFSNFSMIKRVCLSSGSDESKTSNE